jgi:hypothetical protein
MIREPIALVEREDRRPVFDPAGVCRRGRWCEAQYQ